MQYKTLGQTGLKVSRIGLGTAEIGFTYGLGHKTVPSDADADCLLKSAVELGINFFDTASIHKLADERIARSGIAKISGVIIATKCAHFLEKGEDPKKDELEKRIKDEVEISLKNLQLDTLPVLQLHGGTKEQIERGDVIEILGKLKQEGKAQFMGISTRGEEASLAAIKSGFFDIIHVAYSILDQRMAGQVLPLAEQKNMGVINRSVFLKGALTSLRYKLPQPGLGPLAENAGEVNRLAKLYNMSLEELALKFVLAEDGISTSLVGTNNPNHLQQAVEYTNERRLSRLMISELRNFAISDPNQVDPSKWPKSS